MTIKTTQKIITIGTSNGITIPAKDLKLAGIKSGDQVDITVQKHKISSDNDQVIESAKNILKQYEQDFKNLADR